MVTVDARDATPVIEHVQMPDGLRVCVEHTGSRGAATVIFAHGFGQTRHAWNGSAAALATRGFHCVSVDGRGHGDSEWLRGTPYRLDQFVDDARAIVRHVGDDSGKPAWIGASMGGLIGMITEGEAATSHFSSLVLVDVTPRWETQGVERIMRFMRAKPEGFASLDDAQNAVREYLPHRANDDTPRKLEKLLVRMDNGRWRWHWDPALLDTVASESDQWSGRLVNAAQKLRLPVLLVSGGRSDIVSERTIAEFQALVPHAEHHCIADATHMVAGDANDRFTAVIADWLDRRTINARTAA
jgi:pimeloyl-ACP methyl ester carboxylesterase